MTVESIIKIVICRRNSCGSIRNDNNFHHKFIRISDSKAISKSLIISVFLIILNVSVNWHVVFSLTRHPSIDPNQLDLGVYRLIIALCQVVGSIICILIVDLVERKVGLRWNYISFNKTLSVHQEPNPFFLLKAFVTCISSRNHSLSTC